MKLLRIPLPAFLIILFLLFPLLIHAQITFERWYGGSSEDIGRSVIQTSDGGYVVTGYTSSFGSGLRDVYIIRTDSLGDTLWTRTYGGTDYDCGFSVIQSSDGNFVIAGWTYSFGAGDADVYLLKVDALGDTIWTRTYGDTTVDIAYSVIETSDKGYAITGWTLALGVGDSKVYLIKTDSLANIEWTGGYGPDAWGYSIAQTFDNGFAIIGYSNYYEDVYLIKTDSLGDSIWTQTYGGWDWEFGRCVKQTPDSGYILTGETWSFGAGWSDIYLIKTDFKGDTIWTRTFGDSAVDRGYSVVHTLDGGYVVAGYLQRFPGGYYDAYLVKTDSLGNMVWEKTYGESNWDEGYSVAQTADAGFIVTGSTQSFGSGYYDVYLIKTDSLGNVTGIQEKPDPHPKTRDIRLKCYPNPFTSVVEIRLHGVSKNGSIGASVIHIFDVTGRRVREFILYPSSFILGATWDGRDEAGKVVAPGIYFLKLNNKPVGKVVKVR